MGALNRLPGLLLGGSELPFLRRVPPDGRGIEKDLGPAQGDQSGSLRIPLIPANQHTDAPVAGVKGGVTPVPRGKVEFLVIERVVGDVHLAIASQQGAVGIQDHRRIVVDTGRSSLEERNHHRHSMPPGQRRQGFGAGTRDGLRQIEKGLVFRLAEVLRLEKLLQAKDLNSLFGCLPDPFPGLLQIALTVRTARHLQQAHLHFGGWMCPGHRGAPASTER